MSLFPFCLEVCVTSVEDAVTAETCGASRVELNTALSLGGLTPSLGVLIEVKKVTTLPVMVMIRPRPGGFAYSEAEWRVLLRDTALAVEHGADGLVFGVLTPEGNIDGPRCRELLRQCGTVETVFHRAFDVTPNPQQALEQLIDLGIRRVLTSGQEKTALNGAALIRQLREQSAGRIEILPAAGINRLTVHDVLTRTGCDQIHASLRELRQDSSTRARPQITFGSPPPLYEDTYDVSCATAIQEMRRVLDEFSAGTGERMAGK